MLPILRVIPVGGVFLAIAILILALNPPGDPRPNWGRMPASGALISRGDHPEWWQFLLLAAVRRAEELQRLRELPDTPLRGPPPKTPPKTEKPPETAAVPIRRDDAGPEDATGTIVQSPNAAMPLDIGETSSTELPVLPQNDQPPVTGTPERAKRPRESNAAPEPAKPQQTKTQRRARRATPAVKPAQSSLFGTLFEGANGPAWNGQSPSISAQ